MATTNTMLDAALLYADQGFSVIPLRGKVCPIRWVQNQTKPATFGQLHVWHRTNVMQNVGIVCGQVSDNLAVIDLDGLDAMKEFQRAFPHLFDDTYKVLTGSGQGAHLYFRCWQLPETTRTKGFELRCDGCYVVAPPSIHPITRAAYVANDLTRLRTVRDLVDVQTWIADKIKTKRQEWATEAARTPIRNGSKYGLTALDNACAKVRGAGEGTANNELNRQAFKLGFMVERGHLPYHYTISQLVSAATALSDRDGEKATLATIRSGLHAGIDRSRRESRN